MENKKLSFVNDYCEGTHPLVLKKLSEINYEKQIGYGHDIYTASAAEKIKAACKCPKADVWFLSGGTQTNQIVIDTMTAPYDGVLAADTAHVNVHEAGAIEHSGHKVLTLPALDGKISAGDLENWIKKYNADPSIDHIVSPGIVYISQPTELGTLYTKAELKAIHDVCKTAKIPLYIDGARLGTALAADTDVTLEVMAKYSEVFYIGGNKCGALFGEALVFTKNNTPSKFETRIKQKGALLAKGWLVPAQFDVLFTDDLYIKMGQNTMARANEIKKALKDKGYKFFVESPTNQIFVILKNSQIKKLEKNVNFGVWEYIDKNYTAVRFVTSWATSKEDTDALIKLL